MNYILVQWPEVQDLMEAEWFDKEAILALGNEEQTGSSSYFIPEERIVSNNYIQNRIKELANRYETVPDAKREWEESWEDASPYEGGMTIPEAIIHIKFCE